MPKRVTVSGIGEPLHNPAAVLDFIEGCRRQGVPVSLTTTGAPLAGLRRFLHLPQNGLMISLHAGTAATHRRLIPRGPDFEALWSLLGEEMPHLSRRHRRKIGINYLLLAGINDLETELNPLRERLHSFPELTLHLLTCNPVPGSSFTSPPAQHVDAIHKALSDAGVNVRRPNRWRIQAEGGCGTLAAKGAEGEVVAKSHFVC